MKLAAFAIVGYDDDSRLVVKRVQKLRPLQEQVGGVPDPTQQQQRDDGSDSDRGDRFVFILGGMAVVGFEQRRQILFRAPERTGVSLELRKRGPKCR